VNMLKATVNGLQNLRRPEEVAKARGKTIADVLPVPKIESAAAEATVAPAAEATEAPAAEPEPAPVAAESGETAEEPRDG
jgi:small subunit ribosomal protein S5